MGSFDPLCLSQEDLKRGLHVCHEATLLIQCWLMAPRVNDTPKGEDPYKGKRVSREIYHALQTIMFIYSVCLQKNRTARTGIGGNHNPEVVEYQLLATSSLSNTRIG